MQNTTRKLMKGIVARKLARELERRNVLPPNQGGYRTGENIWENVVGFAYDAYVGFQRKEQTGRGGRSGRCVQESAIQTADGTPCIIWGQLDTRKMSCNSTPGKKRLPCDLETGSPRPNN